jgi:hypothetical protein
LVGRLLARYARQQATGEKKSSEIMEVGSSKLDHSVAMDISTSLESDLLSVAADAVKQIG